MTKINFERLEKDLKAQEDFRQFPYKDSRGIETIGFGRNLRDVGISKSEACILLQNDIDTAIQNIIKIIPNFNDLNDVRQEVLVNMCFNMGIKTLKNFKNMITAIAKNDFETASKEGLNSVWHDQVGERAEILMERLRSGTI